MEPLWDRVDRNRLKLAAYVVFFVVASTLGVTALLAVPWFLLLLRAASSTEALTAAFWSGLGTAAALVAACAALWAGFALLRSEKWILKRMRATLSQTGELLDTKFALKDMALAAGLRVAPALYVMPDSSTNAFVVAARRRRAVIGVTEGFVRKLSVEQQRAVFANLVARIVSGDTIVSTGITALMWPVHSWRDYRMTVDDTSVLEALEEGAEDELAANLGTTRRPSGPSGDVLIYIFFGLGFAVVAELMAAGHRRALLSTAEKADAEGMLLLKDPVVMLSALQRCIELNNVVPAAGESFAELFYCWTGISSDDEDDPEWLRVRRLREVLGVMGLPSESPDNDALRRATAPPAPRIDAID